MRKKQAWETLFPMSLSLNRWVEKQIHLKHIWKNKQSISSLSSFIPRIEQHLQTPYSHLLLLKLSSVWNERQNLLQYPWGLVPGHPSDVQIQGCSSPLYKRVQYGWPSCLEMANTCLISSPGCRIRALPTEGSADPLVLSPELLVGHGEADESSRKNEHTHTQDINFCTQFQRPTHSSSLSNPQIQAQHPVLWPLGGSLLLIQASTLSGSLLKLQETRLNENDLAQSNWDLSGQPCRDFDTYSLDTHLLNSAYVLGALLAEEDRCQNSCPQGADILVKGYPFLVLKSLFKNF